MKSELKIVYLPVDSLRPYEGNAKLHPAEQIEQIKKSIQDYGFRDPVGVWHGTIVEGHGRILAAKELGLTKVPVINIDDLTDEQRREYALIHNQTTMNSGFDFAVLDEELANLPDFDAEFYGFDIELDQGYGTDFALPDGDKSPVQNMTFTFSDDEAEVVKSAIEEMKKSEAFKRYDNPLNENGNGKALYLVVSEWQAQRT